MMPRLLLPLAAVALAAACSDAPTSPVSLDRVSLDVSLPPPPELRGSTRGGFTASGSAGARVPGSSFSAAVAGPPFTHLFDRGNVEYDANATQTIYGMFFLPLPTPPGLKPGPTPRFIRWNGPSSISTAQGLIYSYDAINNGYWSINLAQYNNKTTNPFQPCASTSTYLCTELYPPVVARFHQIVGTRPNGSFEYRVFLSDPSTLSFTPTPTGGEEGGF